MLTITLESEELFDETTYSFITSQKVTYKLEYSLVALSKWETKWEKPYLPTGVESKDVRTLSENLDFIRCMVIGPIPEHDVQRLYQYYGRDIFEYINAPCSATVFKEDSNKNKRSSGSYVTSELIYYWMFANGIPIDAEKWNLNRLLTLIKIFTEKASEQKIDSKKAAEQQTQLNRQRNLAAARASRIKR